MTQFKNFGFGILAILCITVVFGSSCGKTQSDKNAQVDSETPNQVAEKTTDGTSAYGTEQPATLPSDQPLTPATQLSAQPPGPAPAGKVWFPEHGHWHDATASAPGTMFDGQSLQPEAQLTAQPPGPAPAGKVWSPEHGHWHDATASAPGTMFDGQSSLQPPGPAPAGKVWSPEHGHWHDATSTGSAGQ